MSNNILINPMNKSILYYMKALFLLLFLNILNILNILDIILNIILILF